MLGSGELISGDTKFLDIDDPVLDASGVAHQSPSEMPDLAGDFNRTSGTPLLVSGEFISGNTELDDSGDDSLSDMSDLTASHRWH